MTEHNIQEQLNHIDSRFSLLPFTLEFAHVSARTVPPTAHKKLNVGEAVIPLERAAANSGGITNVDAQLHQYTCCNFSDRQIYNYSKH